MIHFYFEILKTKSRLVAGIRKDREACYEPYDRQALFVWKRDTIAPSTPPKSRGSRPLLGGSNRMKGGSWQQKQKRSTRQLPFWTRQSRILCLRWPSSKPADHLCHR